MAQSSFSNDGWKRPPTEIGDFLPDILEPWNIPALKHSIKPELSADVSKICREIDELSSMQEEQVLGILRDALVQHTCVIEEDPPWPNAFNVQIENDRCQFVRDTSLPCPQYTVKVTRVELVGSRGQGTQLTDSDTDIVAIVRLEGSGHVQQMKEHFLSFGHRELCQSLFECLRRAEGIEVLDTFPHKNRISCCVKGASADVLPALPPESLSFEDLRMDEPGVWIKTYSLNVAKTQWVARQPEVVRHAARLMKLWARAVCHQELTASMCMEERDSRTMEDLEIKINKHALTVVIAALHQSCPSESALELCGRTWQLLSSSRVDLLILVSFDTDFALKLSRGPRFHKELYALFNWRGDGITGLAIEDIMQPDRLYRCSDTIKLETLAVYAACALSRVVTVESWSQMTRPIEETDPCLTDVFAVFVPRGASHFSHFVEARGRTIRCPSGHELLPGMLENYIICDDCQLTVTETFTVGCRQCDFDLCKDCAGADLFMSCQFPVPYQNWPPDV